MAAISLIWTGTGIYFFKKDILRFRFFIFLLLFLAGYFNTLIRDTYDEKKIGSYVYAGEEVYIEGVIDSVSVNSYSVRLMLKSCTCNGERLLNNVIIECNTEVFVRGDEISVYGVILSLEGAENPGQFDERAYYYSLGYRYCVEAEEIELIKGNENIVISWAETIKKKLAEVYSAICIKEDAGVFAAMLLGDKSGMDKAIKELYSDSGIGHVLAISGLHISIIGMGLYKLLRKPGIPYPVCAFISGSLIIFYGAMTGNSVSSIRAVIMFICAVYAQVIGRTYDILSAVSLSALIILLINPYMLTNSGFQLSFMAIVGITIVNMGFGKLGKRNWSSGLAIQLATLPIIMWNYYEVPVYSFVLNLVVIPLMTYVMVSALFGGVIGLIWLEGGRFVIGTAHFILVVFKWMCENSLKLPGSVLLTGRPEAWRIVVYSGLVLLFSLRYQVKEGLDRLGVRFKAWSKFIKASATGFGWASSLIVAAALVVITGRSHKGMEITFLSVGQGDGIYIEMPDGTNMFIDGGSSSKSSVYADIISPFLKYKGINSIDYLFISHNDSDHYSGWLEYVQSYNGALKISNLVLNKADYQMYKGLSGEEAEEKADGENTEALDNELFIIADTMAGDGTHVKVMDLGDKYIFDEAEVISLNLVEYFSDTGSENEDSLVLLIRYGEYDLLLTGDVGEEQEGQLVERLKKIMGEENKLEVLKVAHHGSRYSTSEEFLAYLKPAVAVISCGANNIYGHPHVEVLERLGKVGSDVLLTSERGAVIVNIQSEMFMVE